MNYTFGIDLGTTYSCIAYVDNAGKAVVLRNSEGEATTPSVVYVESDGNIVVGNEAKRAMEAEPDKAVAFIKRKMGKQDNTVILNGKEYTAQMISSFILKKLVQDANAKLQQEGILQENEFVKDVVITCPAYFGMNEKNATMEAGKLAGLNVLDIINEPTAAAISYGVSGSSKEETVLVYDLGGGTFDITVMNVSGTDIRVVCTGGDDTLGGKNWDETLMNDIAEKFSAETGEDLLEDSETVNNLYLRVEEWKKSLTSLEKVNVSVRANGKSFREVLTRAQYEELTRDNLNRTKDLMDNVLNSAAKRGYPLNQIDKILLVGGSSRMPQVAKMIQEEYKVKAALQDPDEAVAKGAAIYAQDRSAYKIALEQEARRTGKTEEELLVEGNVSNIGGLTITNVLSCTYGVQVYDDVSDKSYIRNMLFVNQPLPANATKTFSTSVPSQTGVDITIFESRSTEDTLAIGNRKPLTVISMRFTNPVPAGTPLDLTLTLDNSGILHVQAIERYSNSKLDTTFSLSQQMSDRELREALEQVRSTTVE